MSARAPLARKDRLIVRELPEEALVYDLDRHRAYCLNRVATLIWKRCDGRTTIPQLVRLLRDEVPVAADEGVVALGLTRLERAHLLEHRLDASVSRTAWSRREVLRRLGGAAAVGLPVIAALTAPTPADAATCPLESNDPCNGYVGPCGKHCNHQCKPGPGERCLA